MKVLVTGGRGFIGSWAVEELLSRGHDPVILDRRDIHDERRIETVRGDIRDAALMSEAMSHVESWLHLAGVLGTQETIANPLPSAETNIIGGLNVLEAASEYDLPGVYIAVGNHWMENTYSISKTATERFCHMYATERGLPVTVVRAYNAYGPGQSVAAPYGPSKVRKIMPSFVSRAIRGHDIELYGDGSQVMDMIFVADVARVLVDELENTVQGLTSASIEAGSGVATTVAEIAQIVISESESKSKVVHLPMRPGEPQGAVVMAPRPVRSDLMPLDAGIQATVDWYLDQMERNL